MKPAPPVTRTFICLRGPSRVAVASTQQRKPMHKPAWSRKGSDRARRLALPSVLIDRIDRSVGKATERAIRSHHLRRLRKVNWEQALDPPTPDRWCAGE